MERIDRAKLCGVAKRVLELSRSYSREYGELWFDGLFLGYLDGKFSGLKRQYAVPKGRIDFRQGGYSPIVIELVVRKRTQHATILYGSQTKKELFKLTRETKASVRYLVLLDRTITRPIEQAKLRQKYKKIKPDG